MATEYLPPAKAHGRPFLVLHSDPIVGFEVPRARRIFEIFSPKVGVYFPDFDVEYLP